MNLARYVAQRLAQTVFTLVGVLVVTFVVSHVVPADPVGAILGQNAPPAQVEKLRADLGLDKPLHQQFLSYVVGAVQGDLGRSIRSRRPVAGELAEFFPATLELAGVAILLAVLVGVPLGVLSAVKKDSWVDHAARIISIGGVSFPVFWTGIILLLFLYYRWDLLPGPGRIGFLSAPPRVTGLMLVDSLLAGDGGALKESILHLIMPATALAYAAAANIARITRTTTLDVLREDYIRTARAKGVAEWWVVGRHTLKNALIPVVTVTGLAFGSLLEGAVLTETIFAWPGLGRYVTTALLNLDYPAIMGGTLYIALVYSLVNLGVDLLYAALDPRIRY